METCLSALQGGLDFSTPYRARVQLQDKNFPLDTANFGSMTCAVTI